MDDKEKVRLRTEQRYRVLRDVFGLEVAMHDPLLVGLGQRAADLREDVLDALGR